MKDLSYDPATGVFTWRDGRVAGYVRSDNGYIYIGVGGRRYYAHRLAWFYVHGFWPKQLDHVDGNKQNNAISNLREATNAQNGANRGAQLNNKLGVKGVRKNRYAAGYEVRLKNKSIGCYKFLADAQQAYLEAAREEYGAFAK